MDNEEFFLDCDDSVSNLSSLSGCTIHDAQRMYDLMTMASDCSSLAGSEVSFEVEVVEDLLTSYHGKRNAFLANISGHRTLNSLDGSTCQTMLTDESSDVECSSEASFFEVQSDSDLEMEDDDDECENDELDMSSHHSTSLDLEETMTSSHETNLVSTRAKSASASSMPNASGIISTLSGSSTSVTNSTLEDNDRLRLARERRTKALERYKDVVGESAHGRSPVSTNTQRQESLIQLVSAIEAMDGAAILGSPGASGKRRSIQELKLRRRESLNSVFSTLDAVRNHKV